MANAPKLNANKSDPSKNHTPSAMPERTLSWDEATASRQLGQVQPLRASSTITKAHHSCRFMARGSIGTGTGTPARL
jgi:hypothetical protein